MPDWVRSDFRELYWIGFNKVSGEVGSWVKADDTGKWPKAAGRIEGEKVIYRHKIYEISSHGPVANREGAYVIKADGLTLTIQKFARMKPGVIRVETASYIEVFCPFGNIASLESNAAGYRWLLP